MNKDRRFWLFINGEEQTVRYMHSTSAQAYKTYNESSEQYTALENTSDNRDKLRKLLAQMDDEAKEPTADAMSSYAIMRGWSLESTDDHYMGADERASYMTSGDESITIIEGNTED